MSGVISFPPEPADWDASLRARMFDQRVVFLTGPLTDEVAGRTAMELMTLDATGDTGVQLHVESPSGDLGAALGVMDVVDTLGVPVTGVARGLVGGPAVGVLAVCGRRVAMPHARFHLHEPDASFSGDARSVERWLEHRRRQWSQYCERIAAALGWSLEETESVLAGGPYLGAEEALVMGLVDEIASPKAEILSMRRPVDREQRG